MVCVRVFFVKREGEETEIEREQERWDLL